MTKDKKHPNAVKALTKMQQQLISAGAEILGKEPTSEDFAFLARHLVQATLPHSDPKGADVWRREEGSATLLIRQGTDLKGYPLGLPYGAIPRLLLYWITSEALRTNNRTLKLGRSLQEFMEQLGLSPANGTGARSDMARLRNQMTRLFAASITFGDTAHDEHGGHGIRRADMKVAFQQNLWWNPKHPNQAGLWENDVTLSAEFFDAITAAPVPLDMRALRALKRSPLALDLYAWCAYNAYRAHQTGKARWATWDQLAHSLGAQYADSYEFGRKIRKEMVKVKTEYPGLRLGKRRGCLEILPESLPSVPPRQVGENP